MEKDIFKIILGYLKYWYLFLTGAAICLFLAFLHIRYNVTPEYYASCKILLNDKEEGGGVDGASFAEMGLIKNSKNIQDEIGVLQSYDLMKQTITSLGFYKGYYVEGRFNEVEIYEKSCPIKVVLDDSIANLRYGVLGNVVIQDEFTYRIEKVVDDEIVKKSTHNFGEIIETDFAKFHLELPSTNINFATQKPVKVVFRNIDGLASSFTSRLRVYNVFDGGGGLLGISLTDPIPERAVDVINKIIQVYAQNSADNKNFLAKSTLKLIDERLELLTNDLNIVEEDVQNFKQRNNVINPESDASRYVGLADQVDVDLAGIRTEINALNALETNLNSSSQTFAPISAVNIESPVLSSSILSYNNELQIRKSLINATGTGNPRLPEMDRKLSETRDFIMQSLRSIKAQLIKSQRVLINKSAEYRSKISSVPSSQRALLEINRDQSIKQNLYLYLLQKREEEALSISVPFSDTRIIETAKATGYPVNGGKMPVYMGALLFGLFVPFTWVFVKDKLNNKVRGKEDIEEVTNRSILGKLASNITQEVVVVKEDSVTPIAELFRLMRHNLKFLSKGNSSQVIMVTSGKQGEGKTFISINLAASLAVTGKKVVVIGLDLRAPKLMKDMKLTNNLGVSDFIVDHNLEINDITVPYDKQNNLFFIGSGAIPPNPGELVLNERLAQLIEKLKIEFDHIIIDTPPIGKVADAHSLASLVDSTLFVVRYNFTKKSELNLINEAIQTNTYLKDLMIVLNDVKMTKIGEYSYGYGKK
ncbi:GumC family protein [Algibacter aquimarinus]|uniref:non-specific protein-tyrosine kinase n=1 Tax=Algibacter aquimarinus TaxID=1136748 RepID=A0ABP9HS07_9FLAO